MDKDIIWEWEFPLKESDDDAVHLPKAVLDDLAKHQNASEFTAGKVVNVARCHHIGENNEIWYGIEIEVKGDFEKFNPNHTDVVE